MSTVGMWQLKKGLGLMGTKKRQILAESVFDTLLFCQRLYDAYYIVGDLSDGTYGCDYYSGLRCINNNLLCCFCRHICIGLG